MNTGSFAFQPSAFAQTHHIPPPKQHISHALWVRCKLRAKQSSGRSKYMCCNRRHLAPTPIRGRGSKHVFPANHDKNKSTMHSPTLTATPQQRQRMIPCSPHSTNLETQRRSRAAERPPLPSPALFVEDTPGCSSFCVCEIVFDKKPCASEDKGVMSLADKLPRHTEHLSVYNHENITLRSLLMTYKYTQFTSIRGML